MKVYRYQLRWTACIFLIVFCQPILAQQDPQFSQYMHNRLFLNPAVAGANESICATLVGRRQWTGFDGAPATGLFSVQAPIYSISSGIGMIYHIDKVGPITTMGNKLALAYKSNLSSYTSLPGEISVGLGLGIISKTFTENLNTIDSPTLDQNTLIKGSNARAFDMDFGFYYVIPKNLYIGFSVMHLNQAEILFEKNGQQIKDYRYELRRTYYLMGGYYCSVGSSLNLEPSVFVKSDGFSTQADINCSATYKELIWGGLSYRINNAVVPMLGFKRQIAKSKLIASYSYDLTTNKLRTVSSGSHEVLLRFSYNIDSSERQ